VSDVSQDPAMDTRAPLSDGERMDAWSWPPHEVWDGILTLATLSLVSPIDESMRDDGLIK
jgi:hypothetical protein